METYEHRKHAGVKVLDKFKAGLGCNISKTHIHNGMA